MFAGKDELEGTVVLVGRDGVWKITIEFDDGRVVESNVSFATQDDAQRAMDAYCETIGARQYKVN